MKFIKDIRKSHRKYEFKRGYAKCFEMYSETSAQLDDLTKMHANSVAPEPDYYDKGFEAALDHLAAINEAVRQCKLAGMVDDEIAEYPRETREVLTSKYFMDEYQRID